MYTGYGTCRAMFAIGGKQRLIWIHNGLLKENKWIQQCSTWIIVWALHSIFLQRWIRNKFDFDLPDSVNIYTTIAETCSEKWDERRCSNRHIDVKDVDYSFLCSTLINRLVFLKLVFLNRFIIAINISERLLI
jgi:hypothetical protein